MVSTSPPPPRALAPKMPDNSPPATVTSSTSATAAGRGNGGCRRKIAFHPTLGYPMPPVLPAKVERRNLRERNRVKQVNCGFDYLRSHIPGAAKQKKMSKVETLRHAVEYIQMLQRLLGEKAGPRDEEIPKRVKLPAASQPQTVTSQPPPPPITSPPAIPTPSSTVSSSEASTTPFEAVHFQYPSPLTPKTPTPYDPHRALPSYESGYDTASYYSSSSSSSASFMATSPPPHQQVNFCYPPSEPSHPQSQHAESFHSYDYYGADAVNSEEDELLDVIARWQDQED